MVSNTPLIQYTKKCMQTLQKESYHLHSIVSLEMFHR